MVKPPKKDISGAFFYYLGPVEVLISGLVSFWITGSFWLLVIVAGFTSCGGPKKLSNMFFVSSPVLAYTLVAAFKLKRPFDYILEPNKFSDEGFTLEPVDAGGRFAANTFVMPGKREGEDSDLLLKRGFWAG